MDSGINVPFAGRVAVLGLGYIGLPTAVALATRGIEVIGVDINPNTVAAISRGEVPFAEPDLAIGVNGAIAMGRLSVTTETPGAEAYIIAVPTPFDRDRMPDLSYVRAATEQIAPQVKRGTIVVLESTSPPGTTENVSRWIETLRPDLVMPHSGNGSSDVYVAHCPERVLPGRIMIEIVTNDRIIGGITRRCADKAASIYRIFTKGDILLTDSSSAELVKLVENAYRDVNIAFANELSLISESLQLDVWEIIRLANRHPRVNILNPGPGVGGHCIAVDPWFIVSAAPGVSRLIRTAREINDQKPHHVAKQIVDKSLRFRSPRIACLGLTFKANVDDTRESPAVEVVKLVADSVPAVSVFVADPYVVELPNRVASCSNVQIKQPLEAIEEADIVALLVDHDQFKSIPRTRLSGKVVYDTRGAWR